MDKKVMMGVGVVVVILLIFAGWYYANSAEDVTNENVNTSEEVMEKDSNSNTDSIIKSDDATDDDSKMDSTDSADDAMQKDGDSENEEQAMKKSGSFVDYTDTDISKLEGDIVLDFSAPWCPTCQAFKKNVTANLEDIPAGVTIISVDYDTNIELRKKYGVTVQHTFVQVTPDGEKIKSWIGGLTVGEVVAKIK